MEVAGDLEDGICSSCQPKLRGRFSDLPPDMLKPVANQPFGSKSTFGQQIKKTKKTHTKSYLRKTAFIFDDTPPPSLRQITFCRKRRFQHIGQQITETPSAKLEKPSTGCAIWKKLTKEKVSGVILKLCSVGSVAEAGSYAAMKVADGILCVLSKLDTTRG